MYIRIMFWLHKVVLRLFILIFFMFCLVPILYSLDFNISSLGNNLGLDYVNIDTNQAIFRIDIDSDFYPFDLNLISLDINSFNFYEDFLLFKDTNVNGLFDSNDSVLDVNLVYSNFSNNNYDLNIICDLEIDSNLSFFVVVNLNSGVGSIIDFNVVDVISSVDGNINYLDDREFLIVPKHIVNRGNVFYNSVFLDYYSFSDINGDYVSDIYSLNSVLDFDIFSLYIDGNDYRDYNFGISVGDYNREDLGHLYFDLGEGVINISNNNNFNIDFNIFNFNIIDDYYYLVDGNSLYIFDYNVEVFNYNLISSIDTNDVIYAVDTYDYNFHSYLFLANNSNGIVIYDITDENILDVNNNYVGNVVYPDFNTTYLESFKTPSDLDYMIVSVLGSKLGGPLFYKIDDLIELNGAINSNQKKFSNLRKNLIDTYFNDLDRNTLSVSFKNKEQHFKVEYAYNLDELYFTGNSADKEKSYSSLFRLNNRMFAINFDRNQIDSFNYDDFYDVTSPLPISSYTPSQSIFAITPYNDTNRMFVLLENKIEVLEYNFLDDNFYLDYTFENINTDVSNVYQKMKFINYTLFVGQANSFSSFDLRFDDLNFISYYYIPPIKTSNLFLSEHNIDYELYNNINFDGNINLYFKLYDYNIEINNSTFTPYPSNIYFKDSENSYTIIDDLLLAQQFAIELQIESMIVNIPLI